MTQRFASTPAQIRAAIKEVERCYPNLVLGLRWHNAFPGEDYVPVAVDDWLEPSYQWDDGDPTDWELSGTSTLGVHYENKAGDVTRAILDYTDCDGQLIIVGGLCSTGGEDPGEEVLSPARVMAILP